MQSAFSFGSCLPFFCMPGLLAHAVACLPLFAWEGHDVTTRDRHACHAREMPEPPSPWIPPCHVMCPRIVVEAAVFMSSLMKKNAFLPFPRVRGTDSPEVSPRPHIHLPILPSPLLFPQWPCLFLRESSHAKKKAMEKQVCSCLPMRGTRQKPLLEPFPACLSPKEVC